SPALRWAAAWKVCLVRRSMRACANQEIPRMITMATTGGISIQGEIQASTAKNSNTKGKSTSVVKLAEAIKSRTDSKERRLAAKEPTDGGRFSMRKSSTRSIIRADN